MQNDNIKIFHITPHLGGGVGTVLLNYLAYSQGKNEVHSIASLDYANEKSIKYSKDYGFELISDAYKKMDKLIERIENSDITVVHFWNHPLMYDLLINQDLPASRMIFWLHTAGLHIPYVFPEKLLMYPDICTFSTPLTFETKEVKKLKEKRNFELIFATGGNENMLNINLEPHNGFNVGYVGTVDYFRLHPDFLNVFSKINSLETKFIFCGGPKHEYFKEKVKELGLEDKFEFTGEVSNVENYMKKFDVFGYLLSPNHCGSCDQSLQEAMAAGVVPVVLANAMEKSMVKHFETGLVAANPKEFIHYIELLARDKDLLNKLSKNAKEFAKEHYSLQYLNEKWSELYEKTSKRPKTIKIWNKDKKYSPVELFLESLGDYKLPFVVYLETDYDLELKEILKQPQWQSESKATPKQYLNFFQSKELERICDLYDK